jgi:hypothetical protein
MENTKTYWPNTIFMGTEGLDVENEIIKVTDFVIRIKS